MVHADRGLGMIKPHSIAVVVFPRLSKPLFLSHRSVERFHFRRIICFAGLETEVGRRTSAKDRPGLSPTRCCQLVLVEVERAGVVIDKVPVKIPQGAKTCFACLRARAQHSHTGERSRE